MSGGARCWNRSLNFGPSREANVASAASDDADVNALVGVLLLLREHHLEASSIQVGRIVLELTPRSQLDDLGKERESPIAFDASGGVLKRSS
jgi:hypothetical protein